MVNKKLITIIILIITIVLAIIATFTAYKLYQIGQKPVPSVKPKEKTPEVFPVEQYPCQLTFTVSESPSPSPSISPSPSVSESPSPSPSESPSPSPSESASPSPSPSPEENPSPSPSPSQFTPASPLPGCWQACTYDSQCPGTLNCLDVNGVNRCVNSSCPTESDCICGIAAASPLSEGKGGPAEQLPSAGTPIPTILLALGAILLVALGLLL